MTMKSFVITSLLTFTLGILGISLNSTNLMLLLMSMELLLLSTSMLFIIGASFHNLLLGQLFTIIMFTIAAAESAIGLAMMVAYYKISGKISMKLLNTLSG